MKDNPNIPEVEYAIKILKDMKENNEMPDNSHEEYSDYKKGWDEGWNACCNVLLRIEENKLEELKRR